MRAAVSAGLVNCDDEPLWPTRSGFGYCQWHSGDDTVSRDPGTAEWPGIEAD